MKRRIPTLNEFVDQVVRDKRTTAIPTTGQDSFKEIAIILEFEHAPGNGNYTKLERALNDSFSDDNSVFRIEQDFGEVGGMTRAIVHLMDVPQVQTKFDTAISSLDFHVKVIGAKKFS